MKRFTPRRAATRVRKLLRSWVPVESLSLALPRTFFMTLLQGIGRASDRWGQAMPPRSEAELEARPARSAAEIWRAFLAGLLRLIQAGLAHRLLPWVAALLALAYCTPTLWSGLRMDDDVLHRETLLHTSLPDAMQRLFVFLDPHTNTALIDQGVLPWWSLPEVRISFFRPLAVLTHWVDYQLWPNQPLFMHVQNLLWYAGLCGLAVVTYRRLMRAPLAAGLAGLLFAVNVPHFSAVVAVNARNAVLASIFGFLALGFHDRWRRNRWRTGMWLAPLCLAAALLSAEGGIAVVFYLFAYALCLDEAPWRGRLASLVPYIIVVLLWRAGYQALGFGAYGSDFYLDPGREPLRLILATVERWPVILFGQWVMPDPGIYAFFAPAARLGYWLITAGFMALLGMLLWPLLRRSRLARFWATGMVLSIVPICAISAATGRHLMFVGWGALGLLAQMVTRPLEEKRPGTLFYGKAASLWGRFHRWLLPILDWEGWQRPARILAVGLVVLQGVAYPVAVLFTPGVFDSPAYVSMMDLGPLPGCEGQDVVVVNAPSPGQSIYMLSLREYRGLPLPAHLRILAPSHSPVTVTRVDSYTLRIRPESGYLLAPTMAIHRWQDFWPMAHISYAAQVGDVFFRSADEPLAVGQRIAITGMEVEVLEVTPDGRPLEVRVQFDRPLEEASLRWLEWDWRTHTYRPFVPPPVGATLQIAGPY